MLLGHFDDAFAALRSAGQIFDCAFAGKSKSRIRIERDFMLSRSNNVSAQIALQRKDFARAVVFAKRSMKLMSGLWAALERHCDDDDPVSYSSTMLKDVSALAVGMSELSLDRNLTTSSSSSKGALFWAYAEAHLSSLLENSMLCSHAGLAQDAIFFAEQACQVAQKIGCLSFGLKSIISANTLRHRALLLEGAKAICEATMQNISEFETSIEKVWLYIDYIQLSLLSDNKAHLQTWVDMAEGVLRELHEEQGGLRATLQSKEPIPSRATEQIGPKRPAKRLPAAKVAGQKALSEPLDKSQAKVLPHCSILAVVQNEGDMLSKITGRLKSLQYQVEPCSSCGADPITEAHDLQSPETLLLLASNYVLYVLEQLSSDTFHCVLAETPLCLPASYAVQTAQELTSTAPKSKATKRTTSVRTTPNSVKGVQTRTRADSTALRILETTYMILKDKLTQWLPCLPSYSLHQHQKLFSKVALLASALDCHATSLLTELTLCVNDLGNAIRKRERQVLDAENATVSLAQMLRWPSEDVEIQSKVEQRKGAHIADILPTSWTLVSISLSADAGELIVSRQIRSRQPFILRLPLLRTSADELDSTELSFQGAKTELLKIVRQANTTAHDARSQSDKTSRRDWWTERENLDSQMEALLTNIENLWFGGFRGVLSNDNINEDLLSRFADSLDRSLSQHLPSRQKQSKSPRSEVPLHRHVLELFLRLGRPDEPDLDDHITGLLYFVVDILRLHGEHNAYDEIDFDMMLVQISDAIRAYHNACSAQDDLTRKHTVLVLDKELHCFPWESLPCLSAQSI